MCVLLYMFGAPWRPCIAIASEVAAASSGNPSSNSGCYSGTKARQRSRSENGEVNSATWDHVGKVGAGGVG
jgi:hypothetical protein